MKRFILPLILMALTAALLIPMDVNGTEDVVPDPDAKLTSIASLVRGKSASEATTIVAALTKATTDLEGTDAEKEKRIRELSAVLFAAVINEPTDVQIAVTTALVANTPDAFDGTVVAVTSLLADLYLKTADALAVTKAAVDAAGDSAAVAQAALEPTTKLGVAAAKRVRELADKVEKIPTEPIQNDVGGAIEGTSSTSTTTSTTSTTTSTTSSSTSSTSSSTSTTAPSPTPVGLR